MNILEFLFRNKPWLIKKTINDDIFGLMWFNKDKNSEYNHFQGHLFFKPTNSEIDVFIDSDKLGIDPKQKMFFNEIIEKYSEITDKSSTEITKYLINKHKKPISAINFKREFRLYAISISRNPTLRSSLHFDSIKHSISGIGIELNNWNIVNIID